MQLVYYYSAGDEQIIGYRITIYKERNDIYTIIFEQESFDKQFRDITSNYKILEKCTTSVENEYCSTCVINMKIKTINNPAPEELFNILF